LALTTGCREIFGRGLDLAFDLVEVVFFADGADLATFALLGVVAGFLVFDAAAALAAFIRAAKAFRAAADMVFAIRPLLYAWGQAASIAAG